MRKSRALDLVRYHLETTTTNALHALLLTPVGPASLQQLGLLTLLTREVQEVQLALLYIAQACHHGQHGTAPSTYEGSAPYDPYGDIEGYLTGTEEGVPCRTLSQDLQAYTATLPPLDCELPLGRGTHCALPSHAFGGEACSRAQLHQLAYYDQDLAQLHTLVQQRADLRLIQELL